MKEEQHRPFLPAEQDYFTGDQTSRPNPVAPSMGPVVTGIDHVSGQNTGALSINDPTFTEMNLEFSIQTDSRLYGKGMPKAPFGKYNPVVSPTSYVYILIEMGDHQIASGGRWRPCII